MKKYIYMILIAILCYFIGESIYQEMTRDKTPGKAKRIECQREVTTFEREYDKKQILSFQQSIQNGKINLSADIEKAKYSQSTLMEYISLAETNKAVTDALLKYKTDTSNNDNEEYKIDYYIYENDENDPGKKSKKSKNYAGYILMEIKNQDNKLIYKIQIDFMNKKGLDINKTIQCAVESVMSIK